VVLVGEIKLGRHFATVVALVAASLPAFPDDYATAQAKIERIENERVPAGSRVPFTAGELNAYIQHEAPAVTDGVRQPRLELWGPGVAHGTALIDFAKLRSSQGSPPGWLISKLLGGEHPVAVTAHIRSNGGQATVDLERVDISGIAMDGATLDFLIQHFLLPLYPDAVVGRPFPLGHRIERIDVGAGGVTVLVGH
jgi:hypothetical protein